MWYGIFSSDIGVKNMQFELQSIDVIKISITVWERGNHLSEKYFLESFKDIQYFKATLIFYQISQFCEKSLFNKNLQLLFNSMSVYNKLIM